MRRDEALAILAAHRDELREMGAGSLSLIGDILHEDVGPESRIEVLVELSRPMGYFKFFDIQFAITGWLGQEVFMVTPAEIPARDREMVLSEAAQAF